MPDLDKEFKDLVQKLRKNVRERATAGEIDSRKKSQLILALDDLDHVDQSNGWTSSRSSCPELDDDYTYSSTDDDGWSASGTAC